MNSKLVDSSAGSNTVKLVRINVFLEFKMFLLMWCKFFIDWSWSSWWSGPTVVDRPWLFLFTKSVEGGPVTTLGAPTKTPIIRKTSEQTTAVVTTALPVENIPVVPEVVRSITINLG